MSFISKSVVTIQLLTLLLMVSPALISTADPPVEPCQLLNDGTQQAAADNELYTISLSVGCYNPAELVTVNLTSAVNAAFDGFTMSAAPANNNNNRNYGTFSTSDSNLLRLLNCSGFENDSIASVEWFTNANHSTFHWKADSVLNDVTAVTFRAAVRMLNGSHRVNKTLPRCSQTTDAPTLLTTAVPYAATGASTNNSALAVSAATISNTSEPSYLASASSPTPVEASSSSVTASSSISTAAASTAQSPSTSTLQPMAPASSTLAAVSSSPSSPTIQAAAGSQSPSTVTIRQPDVSTVTKATTPVDDKSTVTTTSSVARVTLPSTVTIRQPEVSTVTKATTPVDGKSTVTTTSSPLATISSVARVTLPPTTTAPRVVPEVTSSKMFTRPGNYSEPIGNATAAAAGQTTVASGKVISGGISARQRFKLHEFLALIFVCCFILSSV